MIVSVSPPVQSTSPVHQSSPVIADRSAVDCSAVVVFQKSEI